MNDSAVLADLAIEFGWTVTSDESFYLLESAPDNENKKIKYRFPKNPADFEAGLLNGFVQLLALSKKTSVADLEQTIVKLKSRKEANFRSALKVHIGDRNFDSIPIDSLTKILGALRGAVAHSAGCEIDNPYSYRPKIPKRGARVANNLEVAHTEHGSFVIVVAAPAGLEQQLSFAGHRPTEVRALTRLATGLSELLMADAGSSKDQALQITEKGLNANMADQLILIAEQDPDVPVSIDFHFSPITKMWFQIRQTSFALDVQMQGRLAWLSSSLKEVVSRRAAFEVRIEGMHSPDATDAYSKHRVDVVLLNSANDELSRFKGRQLKFGVTSEVYKAAAMHHLSGSGPVELIADFETIGDTIRLEKLISFLR